MSEKLSAFLDKFLRNEMDDSNASKIGISNWQDLDKASVIMRLLQTLQSFPLSLARFAKFCLLFEKTGKIEFDSFAEMLTRS